jgi:hypothetical protein
MHLFRFEHRSEPVAPRHRFIGRIAVNILVAFLVTAAFVVAGATAYHFFLRPDDSFWKAIHRATMIISGMGPVEAPEGGGERAFVDLYALLSTLVLAGALGIILTPFVHRVMHHLHTPCEQDEPAERAKRSRERLEG